MPEEFEGDLTEAVFWGADLRGAHFRDVDLTGATITHAALVDVTIDATIDRLVVNGVDVTAFVNERDPWHPLRTLVTPVDAAGMRTSWAALEAEWANTVARAAALPEARLHEPVDDQWSFVQTVRHLVFGTDKWFTVPIADGDFHPIGLPNSGSADFPWPGLDSGLDPSAAEALAVYADRAATVRDHLATIDDTDLDRVVEILENGPHPIRQCVGTVFEETFWHIRYARRDLATLPAAD